MYTVSYVNTSASLGFRFKHTKFIYFFQILNEIGSNKIGIYQFPDLGVDDEDFKDVSMTVSELIHGFSISIHLNDTMRSFNFNSLISSFNFRIGYHSPWLVVTLL